MANLDEEDDIIISSLLVKRKKQIKQRIRNILSTIIRQGFSRTLQTEIDELKETFPVDEICRVIASLDLE